MKVNELMIGDLVQFTSDQWLTEEDACPLKVTCVGEPKYPDFYPYIRIEGRNENYHIDLFQPIPLTQEILEKNGFYLGYTSNQEDAASQIHCTLPEPMWTWDEGAGSIQISFPNESDGGEMYLSDQNFDRDLHFVFCENIYVHELQHALKLCHIEKTIEP